MDLMVIIYHEEWKQKMIPCLRWCSKTKRPNLRKTEEMNGNHLVRRDKRHGPAHVEMPLKEWRDKTKPAQQHN